MILKKLGVFTTSLFLFVNLGCRSGITVSLTSGAKKCANPKTAKSTACIVDAPTDKTNTATSAITITGVSAINSAGTYKLGDVIDITIEFSQIVDVSGVPSLALVTSTDTNTKSDAMYLSGSKSLVLTFRYTVQSNDRSLQLEYENANSLQLNGGSILDLSGRPAKIMLPVPAAQGSLGHSKKLVLDNDRPSISDIESVAVKPGENTPPISFQIGDSTSTISCSGDHLSMQSSNVNLIVNSAVTWSGSYPNCVAVIATQPVNQGTVMITFTIRDAAGTATSIDFPLFVSNNYVYGQSTSTIDPTFYANLGRYGSTMVNGRLFIGGPNKISVWNSFPSSDNQVPDFVMGSSSRNSLYLIKSLDELSLSGVYSLASDGTNLIVADSSNHRVLIWKKAPDSSQILPQGATKTIEWT